MIQRIALLIVFCLTSNYFFSQEKFSCSVLDVATKKPVVYATVALKNIHRGTHADVNGNFEIPIRYKKTGSIIISSIGYRTQEVKLATFTQHKTNVIYLSASNSSLSEVVIKTSKKKKRRLLSTQIVKKAIENILENYPLEPYSYIGYYKDYQQPIGDAYQKTIKSTEPIKYLNVHEAIVETFDDGFDSDKLKSKQNQSLLYNYRTNNDFVQDSTLTVPYDNKSKKYSESVFITPLGGNELTILNLTNAIRNYDKMSFSFANILQKDFLQNHTFKLRKITFSDDVPLYEISFISINKKTGYDYTASGTIYISKQDFAIYKFNYNLYYRFTKNPQYTVTIEYKAKKDKMYLNYITFNNFFEANNGTYFKLDKAVLNPKENGFIINFNRKIDISSLTPFRRNFKVYYKGQKLKILNVSPFDTNNRAVTVSIDQKSIEIINVKKERKNANYANYFTFEINDIKDINGFKINERASLKMNQYREFFVQEIFENKNIPLQKTFIDKSLPLSQSLVTPLQLENDYWMSTPLKSKKN
ncbi:MULTISPECIES: carboxypeptidase-like regulatory domain-containing protein [unclassified Polaribacter]|uniref:carboxypeptidase-like regulatory domain-containing protein n=1 Tax=unclassified Polaribacter TaxID=196858 RepID=UPI001671EDDD|nr:MULTISPECIES: carboxypeptidase-like regulatory domain-containing protein [unclassified Polaribacter]